MKLEEIINEMDNEMEYLLNAYDEALNENEESYYAGKYNLLKKYYEELLKVKDNEN